MAQLTCRILFALVQEVSSLYDVGSLTPKAMAALNVKGNKPIFALNFPLHDHHLIVTKRPARRVTGLQAHRGSQEGSHSVDVAKIRGERSINAHSSVKEQPIVLCQM
jgi:hypothetical protein